MDGDLEFRILGPLEVARNGATVALPSAKQRIVLATLLLKAGHVVEVDELIDHLWQEDVPSAARATAQAYVMRLRRALGEPTEGAGVLRTHQNGYLLTVAPEQFDLTRFTAILDKADIAARARDRPAEAAYLHEALSLWRGRPLSNVSSDSLRRKEIPWLDESRLRALERRIQIDLESGRHRETISELQVLISEYPLREQFWTQLMLALYRASRQADALDAYRRLNKTLADELGLSPGEEAQRLHAAILNQDLQLATPQPQPAVTATTREPSTLPPDMADFVGRQEEIAAVTELLTPRPDERTQRLVVLSGAPGVGKTALAVHIGHKVARHFPDGVLHVNLLGYAPGAPLTVRRALTHLLRTLGMRPEQVPLDLDEQIDLYRSLLAGQRRLILLDNAISPDQVRPLLPAGPGCAVLVTSRNELRGLTALQGARRIPVLPLREGDARQLLAEIAGPEFVAAEPGASNELVQLCGRLPLAVRIAATNLSSRSKTTVTDYVSELQRANRLADLAIDGDEEAAVYSAFGLSYEMLKPEPRHLFRMLGLVPGTDFTTTAAAALTDEPVELVRKLLDQLASASLIQHHSPGRYQFHDLLRLYANHRAYTEESEERRTAALQRLYEFYLTTADAAAGTLNPDLARLSRTVPLPTTTVAQITDRRTAVEWLNNERSNLVAAVEHAAKDESCKAIGWHLADVIAGYLHLRRHDGDLLATATVALDVARGQHDQVAEATTLNTLGVLYWSVGDYPTALDHFGRSLSLHKAAGHALGASTTLTNQGVVYLEDGRVLEAARAFSEALQLGQNAGAGGHAAVALARLGHARLEMGELATAKQHLEQALTTCRALRLTHTEATVLNTLGAVHLRLGEFDQAIACHEEALEHYRLLGSRHDQAEVLQNLAAVHRDSRRFPSAVDYGTRALELARQTRNVRFEVDTLNTIGTARQGMRDWRTALDQHGTALGLAQRIGYRQGEITALIGLAGARMGLDETAAAASAARQAVDLATATRFRLREAQALVVLAEAELRLGKHDSARTHAVAALRLHNQAGNPMGQAASESLLGELAALRADHAAADVHRAAAARLREQLGFAD